MLDAARRFLDVVDKSGEDQEKKTPFHHYIQLLKKGVSAKLLS